MTQTVELPPNIAATKKSTVEISLLSKLNYIANPVTRQAINITYLLSDKQFEKLDLIATWDLSSISQRALERRIITDNSLEIAENHYRVFLGISYLFGSTPAFSGLADDFWHTHLLFTRDYMQMCDAIFGAFLHHQPGFATTQEQNTAWQIMRDSRFKAMFGVDLYPYWNQPDKYNLWSMNSSSACTSERMNCLFPDQSSERMNCLFGG